DRDRTTELAGFYAAGRGACLPGLRFAPLLPSSLLASRAPSTSAPSLAHMICGCTRAKYVNCANPPSVLAVAFFRPTSRASRTMRSATSSGCSTMLVAWLITPGMSTVSLGSLRCSHSRVPRIGKLDGIAAGAHLQDEIGDVLEGNVGAV